MKSKILGLVAVALANPILAFAIPFNASCSSLAIGGGNGTGPVSCAFDAGAGFTINSLTLFTTPGYAGGSPGGTQVDFTYVLPGPFASPQNFSLAGLVTPVSVEQSLGSISPNMQAFALSFTLTTSVSFGSVGSSNAVSRIAGDYSLPGTPVPEPGSLALLSLGLAGLGFTRRKAA